MAYMYDIGANIIRLLSLIYTLYNQFYISLNLRRKEKLLGCASYPYGQMRYALPQTKTQYRILNLFDTLIGYATLSYHYRIFYVTLYCFAHN